MKACVHQESVHYYLWLLCEAMEGLPWELLYVDNLVLVAEHMEEPKEKLLRYPE